MATFGTAHTYSTLGVYDCTFNSSSLRGSSWAPAAMAGQPAQLSTRVNLLALPNNPAPPIPLAPIGLRLLAEQNARVYVHATDPQSRGPNIGVTFSYDPDHRMPPITSGFEMMLAEALLFLDAREAQLASGLGLYSIPIRVADADHFSELDLAVEFVVANGRCESAVDATGASTCRASDTDTSCTSTSTCTSCTSLLACTPQRAAFFTSAGLDSLVCLQTGGAAETFNLLAEHVSSTSPQVLLGVGAPAAQGATVASVSQLTSSTVSVEIELNPTNAAPGIRSLPVQLATSDTASQPAAPRLLTYLLEDSSAPFAAPTAVASVFPATYTATGATSVAVSGSGFLNTAGLQCQFRLDGQTKVVTTSATFSSASVVLCTLPKRADLHDAGLDDETVTSVAVSVSNFGPCGAHTFATLTGAFNYVNACPAGHHLNSAKTACVACPAGRYNPNTGSESSSACIACAAGRYGDSEGEASEDCTAVCPAGFYCPEGSASGTSTPCAPGFFGVEGRSTPSCSGQCAPGHFCNPAFGPQTTATPSGQLCSPGKYGKEGEVNAACYGTCFAGHFCPQGTSEATMLVNTCGSGAAACGPGAIPRSTYCPYGSHQVSCAVPGKYTRGGYSDGTQTGLGTAWAGRYATGDGVLRPCPAGRYGNVNSQTSAACTGLCRRGYHCPEASDYPTFRKCTEGLGGDYETNPAAYYCLEGTTPPSGCATCFPESGPKHVNASYYSTPDGSSSDEKTRTGQAPCSEREVCIYETGLRRARLEITSGSCQTGYLTRYQTWNPDTHVALSENQDVGTAVIDIPVRTWVAGAVPTSTIVVHEALSTSGVPTTDCGSGFADERMFHLDVVNEGGDPPTYRLQVSTAAWHNFERCSSVSMSLETTVVDSANFSSSLSCLVEYQIRNLNDPVEFQKSLLERSIPELSEQGDAAGAEVSRSSSLEDLGSPGLELFDEDAFQGMNFSIVSGNEQDLWLMLSCSGQVKAKQQDSSLLSFEDQPVHTLGIQVCDDGRPDSNITCDTSVVNITLTDVNEPPVFTGPSFILAVAENSPAGTLMTPAKPPLLDPDFPTYLSNSESEYSILDDGGGLLQVVGGEYVAASELDYEAVVAARASDSIFIVLQACDKMEPNPACSSSNFRFNVLDANDPPIVPAQSLSIAENAANDTVVGSVFSLDQDFNANHSFSIVSWQAGTNWTQPELNPFFKNVTLPVEENPFYLGTPQRLPGLPGQPQTRWEAKVYFRGPPHAMDFENVAIYLLEVEVADSGHISASALQASPSALAPLSSAGTLQVLLIDVNEPPELQDSTVSISENLPPGSPCTVLPAPSTCASCIRASEPDSGPGGRPASGHNPQVIQYALLNAASVPFAIDVFTGELTSTSTLNFEGSASYTLTISASDAPPTGPPLSQSKDITVNVINMNEPPILTEGQSFSVAENSAGGTVVGTVDMLDPDFLSTVGGAESHSWSIEPPHDAFSISPTGSILVVADALTTPRASTLDFEVLNFVQLSVAVQDQAGSNDTTTVSISITDVNEPPLPTTGTLRFSDLQEPYMIGRLSAVDSEQAPVSLVFSHVDVAGVGNLSTAQCQTLFPPASVAMSGDVTLQAATKPSMYFRNETWCNLTYSVTDGTFSVQHWALLELMPYNDPPIIAMGGHVVVPEDVGTSTPIVPFISWSDGNMATDVHEWVITSSDPASGRSRFRVSSGAQIFVRSSLNFEDPDLLAAGGNYSLTVRVTDKMGMFDEAEFIVTVTNVNEAPFVVPVFEQACTEESEEGHQVAVLSAVDDDLGDTHTWAIEPLHVTNAGAFPLRINASTGELSISGAALVNMSLAEALDFEGFWGGIVPVRVTVTDSATAPLSSTLLTSIQVADINEKPFFSVLPEPSLPESAVGVGAVITRVQVQDPDVAPVNASWSAMTISLVAVDGATQQTFSVHPTSGDISVNLPSLDFELNDVVVITLQVTDGAGLASLGNVTLRLTNVNDVQVSSVKMLHRAGGVDMLHTNGSDVLLLTGANLGYADGQRESAIFLKVSCPDPTKCVPQSITNCSQMAHGNNTAVLCSVPQGVGKDLHAALLVDLGLSGSPDFGSLPRTLGYSPPLLHEVINADSMNTRGGDTVVLRGENFGPLHMLAAGWHEATYARSASPAALRSVYTAVACNTTASHVEIECRSVQGVGGGLQWQLRSAGQASALAPQETSYAIPQVHSVTTVPSAPVLASECGGSDTLPANKLMSTAGGEILVIRGDFFGGFFGGTQEGATTVRLAPRAPTAPAFSPPIYSATSCVLTDEHQEIRCMTPSGAGAAIHVQVTVAALSSALNSSSQSVVQFRAPRIVGVQGPATDEFEPPEDLKTEGMDVIVVRGDQLGQFSGLNIEEDVVVTYGPPADPFRYTATDCGLTQPSSPAEGVYGSIQCSSSAGVGKGLSVTATVRGQLDVCAASGQPLPSTLAYAPPSIRLYEGPGSSDAATVGGQEVRIKGGQFGPRDNHTVVERVQYFNGDAMAAFEEQQALVSAGYGGNASKYVQDTGEELLRPPAVFTAKNCTLTGAHVEITCRTGQGAGENLRWRVTIGNQTSTDKTSSYDPPKILLVGPTALPGRGGDTVSLHGINFGPSDQASVGTFLDFVSFGADHSRPSAADYLPLDCSVWSEGHFGINCTLPPGWSPPEAASRPELQYAWHLSVRGQPDVKDTQFPGSAISIRDKWHYASPELLWLEDDSGLNTVSGEVGVNPFTSALRDNKPGAPHYMRIVGKNLGVQDTARVSLSVHILDTALPFTTYSASFSGVELDVLRVEIPVGHGVDIPVTVTARHSMFPGMAFTIPSASPLQFSYRRPQLNLIKLEADAPSLPGYADVEPLVGSSCTFLVLNGSSFGAAYTFPSVGGVSLEPASPAPPPPTNFTEWLWGPNMNNLTATRKDDHAAPKPFVKDPLVPLTGVPPASPGWIWTTSAGVKQLYVDAGATDYILSVSNLSLSVGPNLLESATAPELVPLPKRFVAAWDHDFIKLRMPDQGQIMVCSGRPDITASTCTKLEPYEQISLDYGDGNGCPVVEEFKGAPTQGGGPPGSQAYYEVIIKTAEGLTAAVCENENLNIQFLFGTEVRPAPMVGTYHQKTSGYAALLETNECLIRFLAPEGAGKGIRFYVALGKAYDESSYCIFQYALPVLTAARTFASPNGTSQLPALRTVSSVEPASSLPLTWHTVPVLETGVGASGMLARGVGAHAHILSGPVSNLRITVPSNGAIVHLEGSNLGRGAWGGVMTMASQDQSLSQFAAVLADIRPALAQAQVQQVVPSGILEDGLEVQLTSNHTTAIIVVPPLSDGTMGHLALRVGGQDMPQFVQIAYEPPAVNSVQPSLGNTTGGQRIVILGTNFGTNASVVTVSIDGRLCSGVRVLEAFTKLEAFTPVGEGVGHEVVVSVAGQSCAASCLATFSYHAPTLLSVEPQDLPTDGSGTINIRGYNFGVPQQLRGGEPHNAARLSPIVQLAPTRVGDLRYTVPDPLIPFATQSLSPLALHGGQLLRVDHGVIELKAPQGQGGMRLLELLVAGQRSTNAIEMRFQPPHVQAMEYHSTPTRGYVVKLVGLNLGRFEPATPAAIDGLLRAQPSSPATSNARFDRSLGSKGAASGMNVTVLAPGTGTGLPCLGFEDKLSIFGDQVPRWKMAKSGERDGGDEERNTVYDLPRFHSYHFCVMPPGFGPNVTAVYSLDGVPGQGNFTVQYNPPFIARMTPNVVNAAGMNGLQVFGEDFGPPIDQPFGTRTNVARLIIGSANCSELRVSTSRSIECNVGRDTIGMKVVTLSAAGYVGIQFPKVTASASPSEHNLSARALLEHEANTLDRVLEAQPSAVGTRHHVSLSPFSDSLYYAQVYTVRPFARGLAVDADLEDALESAYINDLEIIPRRSAYDTHYKMSMLCDAEQYGQVGEYCEPCPQGAVCLSGADQGCAVWGSDPVRCIEFVEPFSMAGWWSEPVPTSDRFCHGPRQAGANGLHPLGRPFPYNLTCPRMLPCEPSSACTGNNTCKYGYDGYRCKDCLKGEFYRVAGECIRCPQMAEVYIALFCVGIVLLCICGYILNRKKMHLAFISIGVDYMQVLAIFSRSKVRWPAFIRDMFRLMSMFNLNIDITAPECAIPDVSYAQKWFVIEALPLCIGGLLFVVYIAILFYNSVVKGVKGKAAREHGTTITAMCTLIIYYMYLLLTRTTFDVFNCQPTDPPDGYELGYMEAVFERCYEPGGMHMMLLGPAIATLVVYVIGYPVGVMYALNKYKFQVKGDQILRAMDLGDQPSSPFYRIRRVYHKLYYHFLPDKWYWIMLIIFRKFCIALTSLMFRRTPSFQMALCFCILFFSYAMHAQHAPYMSMASRRQVVLLHYKRMEGEAGLPRAQQTHTLIDQQIASCRADAVKERRRKRTNMADIFAATAIPGKDYLFSYNTMEAVLLSCGCFVCLSGIMFQTGDDSNPVYAAQRDVLTVLVMVVVFGSLTYFFTVFGTEVMVTFGCLSGPPQGRRGVALFVTGVLCCYTGVLSPVGAFLCRLATRRPPVDDKRRRSLARANKSLDDAIDLGGEDTGVGMNPLALRAAATRGAGVDIDAVLKNKFPPNTQQWLVVQERWRQLNVEEADLRLTLSGLQTSAAPVTPRASLEGSAEEKGRVRGPTRQSSGDPLLQENPLLRSGKR